MAVTWNPLDKGTGVTLSNGNLTAQTLTGYTNGNVRANTAITSGKKYWEIHWDSGSAPSIGIANSSASLTTWDGGTYSRMYYSGGQAVPGFATYGTQYIMGDTIGVLLDMDAGTIAFSKNGTVYGTMVSDVKSALGSSIFPYLSNGGSIDCKMTANFGATPFAYPIPTGYMALDGGTPPAIDISITSIIASATSQAIVPIISTENIISVNINGAVASSTNEAIIPIVSANSSLNVNINGVLATSSSEVRIPTITSEIVLSAIIEALRSDSTSKFIKPLISVIRNEIARLNLSEKVRKPITKIKDRDIMNSEQTRNIRTEVI